MARNQVLKLVGPPNQSGYPEKIAETWVRPEGLLGHHRLFVVYDVQNVQTPLETWHVEMVWDGVWWRRIGFRHPRHESNKVTQVVR